VSLPRGVYRITSRGSAVDGGFGFYNQTPYVQLYPTNGASGQQWRGNGSTFSKVLIAAGGSSGAAGPLLADASGGTATENASGDTSTVSPPGDDYTIRDSRTSNDFSVVCNAQAMSATRTLSTIAALASPTPTAITLTPASVTIADIVPTGTPLAAAAVTKSDGAQFSGTLTTSYTDFFAISGLDIITARALSGGADRAHATVIAVSANLSIHVVPSVLTIQSVALSNNTFSGGAPSRNRHWSFVDNAELCSLIWGFAKGSNPWIEAARTHGVKEIGRHELDLRFELCMHGYCERVFERMGSLTFGAFSARDFPSVSGFTSPHLARSAKTSRSRPA